MTERKECGERDTEAGRQTDRQGGMNADRQAGRNEGT